MAYARVDDHLHAHRKTLRAGVPAMGLWVLAASWSMGEGTDGWVPDYVARRLDPDLAEHAEALVAAGLWHEDEQDGDRGWRFHQWDEHQHTTAYITERRRRNANRMRRERAQSKAQQAADQPKDAVRAHAPDTAPDVYGPQPNPTQPKNTPTAAAAEFDDWWQLYPKKSGKKAAAKAYAKARTEVDAETLTAGLANAVAVWQASRTEPQFIPHPTTWLNQGRWADEQLSLPGSPPVTQAPTACQCGDADPHDRHRWEDSRNRYWCAGVGA